MSRTYRNIQNINRCALRSPKTSNERKQLIAMIQDNQYEDYPISGMNHIHHRLSNCPTSWDDLVVSGYLQQDYKF